MDTEEKREEEGNRKASQSSYSGSSGNGEAERTKGMFQKNHELVRDGLKDLELERVWKMAGPMEQGHIHQWHLPHRLVCPAPH